MRLTLEQLCKLVPSQPATRLALFLPGINRALVEFNVDTPVRASQFLAQALHESARLQALVEYDHRKPVAGCKLCERSGPHAAGVQYEGRKDLGNTQPGDGERFKGRGIFQLTGRTNYQRAGRALGLDLETQQDLAADPSISARIAGWYWELHGLNVLADANTEQAFTLLTKRINGGVNGLADRLALWAHCKKVLGC